WVWPANRRCGELLGQASQAAGPMDHPISEKIRCQWFAGNRRGSEMLKATISRSGPNDTQPIPGPTKSSAHCPKKVSEAHQLRFELHIIQLFAIENSLQGE